MSFDRYFCYQNSQKRNRWTVWCLLTCISTNCMSALYVSVLYIHYINSFWATELRTPSKNFSIYECIYNECLLLYERNYSMSCATNIQTAWIWARIAAWWFLNARWVKEYNEGKGMKINTREGGISGVWKCRAMRKNWVRHDWIKTTT